MHCVTRRRNSTISPGKLNAKWPVPAQISLLPRLQEIVEQKVNQIVWRARKDWHPQVMHPMGNAQIQRREPVDDQPKVNRKWRATIHNPNRAPPKILRMRDKTEIAASSRMAKVTMESQLPPGINRADRVKLKLETMVSAKADRIAVHNRRRRVVMLVA